MHPVDQIGRLLQLPPQTFRNIALLALGRSREDASPLSAYEELSFIVASWAISIVRVQHADAIPLLREMRDHLFVVAPECEAAWKAEALDAPIPPHELHFADNRFATWGVYDQFWDTREGCKVNPLPTPPVWRTSAHLCGLYFSYQMQKESMDAAAASNTQKSAG
jgi:hypothetical protein